MPIGAAVITKIRAIVDQRAPNTILRAIPAAIDASQMPVMSRVRERFVNGLGPPPGPVLNGRRRNQGLELLTTESLPAGQAFPGVIDLACGWDRPRSGALPRSATRKTIHGALRSRAEMGLSARTRGGVLLERWLAQCGMTTPLYSIQQTPWLRRYQAAPDTRRATFSGV